MKKQKKKTDKDLVEQMLVEEVTKDFKKRQEERRTFEAQWQLNMNFYMGNQYCDINGNFELQDYEKKYFWQEHDVFNHISPLVERRIAKLIRVRPKMNVLPASNDERDIKTAKLSKKIIDSICNSNDMTSVIMDAIKWSEICGTSFYKVIWNSSLGNTVALNQSGLPIREGDVQIVAVSPFEIFPESSSTPSIESSRSLIHARAYHIDEIKNKWGVDVSGSQINVYTLDKNQTHIGGISKVTKLMRDNYAVVIERYEAPSVKFPNGRLLIVCEDTLLHSGELPFINSEQKQRGFPFIKQDAFSQAGTFWGTSVIERLIPLQRSYNAIKNRKHEFINRLSMGVLTVEDGSIDIENLEEDGVCPGKVLVYRQGSEVPKYMKSEDLPCDFSAEEQWLLKEFSAISGITDLSSENFLSRDLSGKALEIMVEHEENKMQITADNVQSALRKIASHILRLYKQFVKIPKLTKVVGDNGQLEMFYFNSSDITSEDIVFETKNEFLDSFTQRREMLFELIQRGILTDENGKLSNKMKNKILEMLGFGIWESAIDITELHRTKASKENYKFLQEQKVEISEIDDHSAHLEEHISFALGAEFEKAKLNNNNIEIKLINHINEHKKYLNKK